MKSAKKSAKKPKPAFQGAVRLRKMPKHNENTPLNSTQARGSCGLGKCQRPKLEHCFGSGKAKTIRVGDIFMVKRIASGKVKMVG